MKPVRHYRCPLYPTRTQVLEEPDLLHRHQPDSWCGNARITALFGAFLAASAFQGGAEVAPPASAVVAPVFEHGEGRGAMGCVVSAPPVFLSEEEALQIITEELRVRGIEAAASDQHLGDLMTEPQANPWSDSPTEDVAEPALADLEVQRNGVRIEYISIDDYYRLGGRRSASTVQDFDTRRVAELTASKLADCSEDVTYGVFYDPLESADLWRSSGDGEGHAALSDAGARARRQLRLQVRDFVDWMMAQGII